MKKKEIWFDDIDENHIISEDNFKIFEQLVASSFRLNKFNPDNLSIKDKYPRIIFISIAKFPISATVFHGSAVGILAAFESAFKKTQKRFDCSDATLIIKIDLVSSVKVKKQYHKNSQYIFKPAIEGIAFEQKFDLALLPEEMAFNRIWSEEFKLLPNRVKNYLEKNPTEVQKFVTLWLNQKFYAYIFKTKGFILTNNVLTPIFRGQYLYHDVTKQDLYKSIEIAGKYLLRAIMPNGRYEYQYRVDTNFVVRDYNFLRHAGTSFALAEYLEFTKDKTCLPILKKALEYMKLFAFKGLEDQNTICFSDRGLVKLGGNGLAALSLAKYIKVTDDYRDKTLLTQICNWILTQTKNNGDFKGHKQRYHDGSYSTKKCPYYPGEVIYGLAMSYNLLGEDKWLNVANNIAHWMILQRDKGIDELKLEHDHWLLYGLNELHRITPHQIYIDQTIRICRAIMHRQILKSEYPDYIGAHNNRKNMPSSTQAATRSEGLLAAYKLLRDFGNVSEFANEVLQYAKRSIMFQLRTQYNELTTMYVYDAQKAYGGFRGAIDYHDIRIDYVQHNLSSLISLYNIN